MPRGKPDSGRRAQWTCHLCDSTVDPRLRVPVWKLSPPAGLFDPRELFDRDGPPSFLVDARGRLRISWHGDAAEVVVAAADREVNVSDALEGLDGIENLEPVS